MPRRRLCFSRSPHQERRCMVPYTLGQVSRTTAGDGRLDGRDGAARGAASRLPIPATCAYRQRTKTGILVQTEPVHDCAGNVLPDGTIVTFTATGPHGKGTVDCTDQAGCSARSNGFNRRRSDIRGPPAVVMGNEIRVEARHEPNRQACRLLSSLRSPPESSSSPPRSIPTRLTLPCKSNSM